MKLSQEPGRFYHTNTSGKLLAEITFEPTPNEAALIIEHTYVDPSLRGQGVAQQLIQAVIQLANQHKQQIVPVCSYAASYFERHPELQSLRYQPNE